jgi:hypothetical protein
LILAKTGFRGEKKMGGLGSGSWYRYDSKRTVEGQRSIDARWLVREGIIKPGVWRSGSLRWTSERTAEDRGSIGYTVEAREDGTGTMTLKYTYASGDPEEEKLEYPVRLVTTRPHLGGLRWWFICPLVVDGRPCRRRVAKLYGPGKYFGCRTCKGLVYESSQEAHRSERLERSLRRMWRAHRGFPDPEHASRAELFLMVRALYR